MKLGFTIIELLVVISVLSILGILGFAAYRDFQQRQELRGAVKSVEADLLFARQKAFSGEKPAGCTGTLVGWRVNFQADSYEVIADCASVDTTMKTVPIGKGVTKTAGPTSVTFKALGQGIAETEDVTFTFTHSPTGRVANITVTKAGLISLASEAGVQPTPTPTPTSAHGDVDKDTYQAGTPGTTCPNGKLCDCYDNNANAFPGQTGYFTNTRGTSTQGNDSAGNTWNSYDYDCNGTETKKCEWTSNTTAHACTSSGEQQLTGWISPPGCGGTGDYIYEITLYRDTSCTTFHFNNLDSCSQQMGFFGGSASIARSTVLTMPCR